MAFRPTPPPASEDFITVRINRQIVRSVVSKVRGAAIVIAWLLGVVASCLAIVTFFMVA